MKESVSAVFVSKEKVFFIKRQNYLPVFPGYYSTPGGKVDKSDEKLEVIDSIFPKNIKPAIIHALVREIQEELNYDLLEGIRTGEVKRIDDIGVAITPDFNPYRFSNYYFKITISTEKKFDLDQNEAAFGEWCVPSELYGRFKMGLILAVPPAIILLKTLVENLQHSDPIDMTLACDLEKEVPMIESLYGVRQLLPLSNTFPPANRTNSFIIGDGGEGAPKILIDPSPKDENELKKFIVSIKKIGFDSIFLTHHHLDHYQYSREIALRFKASIQLSSDTFMRIKKNSGENYFDGINVLIRKEGDVVTKSLGEEIRVYEVPGHDEGQLGLAPLSLNWFLVGDLVQTIGTVVIQAPEGDMKKYFQTLERVISLNPKNIIPSHGIIVGGIHKIKETLKHRKMREEAIVKLLNQNKTEDEILSIIYEGLEENLIPFAKKTIAAHLKKIKEDSVI